ncbi:hypothetical protein C7E18_23035, partial [Stenotrophomonas maltophilia]
GIAGPTACGSENVDMRGFLQQGTYHCSAARKRQAAHLLQGEETGRPGADGGFGIAGPTACGSENVDMRGFLQQGTYHCSAARKR